MRATLALLSCAGTFLGLAGCGRSASTHSAESSAQQRWANIDACLSRPATPRSDSLKDEQGPVAAPQLPPSATAAARAATVFIETEWFEELDSPAAADKPRLAHRRSGGTGVVIGSGRVVLTNEHVIRSASCARIRTADGGFVTVVRWVTLPRRDVALLFIAEPLKSLTPLCPESASLECNHAVVTVERSSAPAECRTHCGHVIRPVVSLQCEIDPREQRDYSRLIETNLPLEPGHSGSPLIDAAGRFVGLNVAVWRGATPEATRAYALPFDATLLAELNDLLGSPATTQAHAAPPASVPPEPTASAL